MLLFVLFVPCLVWAWLWHGVGMVGGQALSHCCGLGLGRQGMGMFFSFHGGDVVGIALASSHLQNKTGIQKHSQAVGRVCLLSSTT